VEADVRLDLHDRPSTESVGLVMLSWSGERAARQGEQRLERPLPRKRPGRGRKRNVCDQ